MDALSGTRLIFRFHNDTLTIDADDTLVSLQGLNVPSKNLSEFYC